MGVSEFNEDQIRDRTRRILQIMNQYSLMEVEYENKQDERTLKLRRETSESSPPLLEGRSEHLPGQVRSPTVGRLTWHKDEDESVARGEEIGEISKRDEAIPVKAPRDGRLKDRVDSHRVEFGETLARVVRDVSEEEDQESS